MKKGISLIVLVITIIVMIIIAGAIIISLNSSNVISKANQAVTDSDLANARNAAMLAYAELAAGNNGIAVLPTTLPTWAASVTNLTGYYTAYLTNAGFKADAYTVTVDSNGIPKVDAKTTPSNG